MAIIVSTWVWGTKYGPEYVERLRLGVQRWYGKSHRWCVFEPEREDQYLTTVPGCFCRLRMFDTKWQARQGINEGDTIVCMDLDSIVTGPLGVLFKRDEDFVILHGANSENPNPFNGSLMMLRAGCHERLWTEFSLEATTSIKYHAFPDDQAWIWHMLPNAAGWKVGSQSGIYAFKKPGWPTGNTLPRDARLVVFPGWRDPAAFAHLPWIQEKWVALAATGHVSQQPRQGEDHGRL